MVIGAVALEALQQLHCARQALDTRLHAVVLLADVAKDALKIVWGDHVEAHACQRRAPPEVLLKLALARAVRVRRRSIVAHVAELAAPERARRQPAFDPDEFLVMQLQADVDAPVARLEPR